MARARAVATTEEDVRRWLLEGQLVIALRFASAAGRTVRQVTPLLEAAERARLIREGSRDGLRAWKLRRPDPADPYRVMDVVAGRAQPPDPRPFAGDAGAFELPPRPGDVRASHDVEQVELRLGDAYARVTVLKGTGMAEYQGDECNHDLAEVLEGYGRRRVAYVDEVVVPSEARGRGVGRRLMAAALWESKLRRCAALFLHAYPLDDDTDEEILDDFYRDAGLHYRRCCAGDGKPVYWFDFDAAKGGGAVRRNPPSDGAAAVSTSHPRAALIAKVARSLAALGDVFCDGRRMSRAERAKLAAAVRRAGAEALGHGCDRVAVALPGGDVVKIARHPDGAAANRRELERWVSGPPHWKPHLMPVTAADPGGSWLTMPRSEGPPVEAWFGRLSASALRYEDVPWPRDLSDAVRGDFSAENWGRYGGRSVLLDYA